MLRIFSILLICILSVQSSLAFEEEFKPVIHQEGKLVKVYIPSHYQDKKLYDVNMAIVDENEEGVLATRLIIEKADDEAIQLQDFHRVVLVVQNKKEIDNIRLYVSYQFVGDGKFGGCLTTKEINLLDII